MYLKSLKNQQGQTLAIILVIMTMALIMGAGISATFITNLRSRVTTDESYRAEATAQGLAERLLLKDFQTLKDYITYNNCGSECTLTVSTSDFSATANATLTFLGNSTAAYEVEAKTNVASEINLTNYGTGALDVCWNDGSIQPSVIAMLVHGSVGNYQADSYAYNSSTATYTNGFSSAIANFGYNNCFTVAGRTNPQFLRIRTVYADSKVYVKPTGSASIPSQGVKITVVGSSGGVNRTVTVTKSDTYLPVDFEFALFHDSTTQPLTNVQITP
jgi:hypothetical protein